MDDSRKDSRSQRDKRRIDKQHSRLGRGRGGSAPRRPGVSPLPQPQRAMPDEPQTASVPTADEAADTADSCTFLEAVAQAESRAGASRMQLASEAGWRDGSSAEAVADCDALGAALARLPWPSRLLIDPNLPDIARFHSPESQQPQQGTAAAAAKLPVADADTTTAAAVVKRQQSDREVEE